MTSFALRTSWGATVEESGAKFRLWAPGQGAIELVSAKTAAREPMRKQDAGWFELDTDLIAIGDGYSFRLPNGQLVPDPAARAQIGDVHGPSKLVDPEAYRWKTPDWKGRPWEDAVIYELHTGTFTSEATFDGIAKRLDHLQSLGITAIEIMPVAQFGGTRGWGYDGVLHYAPHQIYGSPENLKALIDEAHGRGLMVLLDVVYNHFGPDGNYIGLYAPQFFHPELKTPWGAGIAYDLQPVRQFFIENALYWLEEYRFDGLRFDAIDQIRDTSSVHLLDELAETVRRRIPDRQIHLTTEDDRNIVSLHARHGTGETRRFTAEWNDDFHHVVHALATDESDGYYADYAPDAARHLARALTEGYVYQGEPSPFRDGELRGEPSRGLPPSAFVNFLQNHDQIGNRAFGERLATLIDEADLEILTALLLLSPFTPLIFMGEEWAEHRPFLYFTDFDGDLGSAVREGRRNEFRKWKAFADPALREKIPDPNDPATARASEIDWAKTSGDNRQLALVKSLLKIRSEKLVPHLKDIKLTAAYGKICGPKAVAVGWPLGGGKSLELCINLGADARDVPALQSASETLFASNDEVRSALENGSLPPKSIVVVIGP
ncbi:MAG: malto-oligosyltrehalose trehalohydrolase, partial [Hyphomicrobium sp.]